MSVPFLQRLARAPRIVATTLGDMLYSLANGDQVKVRGTPGTGKAPVVQSDGELTWTLVSSLTGGVADGDYGDVVVSGGGTVFTIQIPNSGVTPGSYTNANITVGADGRITAAANGSGGGGGARTTTTITTATLASGAQETGSFTIAKGTVLVRAVAVFGRQCRVRLYGTSAARDADVARAPGVSALSGSGTTGTGIACDLVLSSAEGYDLQLDPKAVLADPTNPSTTTLYYTIDNLTTGSVPVAVALHHTPIET